MVSKLFLTNYEIGTNKFKINLHKIINLNVAVNLNKNELWGSLKDSKTPLKNKLVKKKIFNKLQIEKYQWILK